MQLLQLLDLLKVANLVSSPYWSNKWLLTLQLARRRSFQSCVSRLPGQILRLIRVSIHLPTHSWARSRLSRSSKWTRRPKKRSRLVRQLHQQSRTNWWKMCRLKSLQTLQEWLLIKVPLLPWRKSSWEVRWVIRRIRLRRILITMSKLELVSVLSQQRITLMSRTLTNSRSRSWSTPLMIRIHLPMSSKPKRQSVLSRLINSNLSQMHHPQLQLFKSPSLVRQKTSSRFAQSKRSTSRCKLSPEKTFRLLYLRQIPSLTRCE